MKEWESGEVKSTVTISTKIERDGLKVYLGHKIMHNMILNQVEWKK